MNDEFPHNRLQERKFKQLKRGLLVFSGMIVSLLFSFFFTRPIYAASYTIISQPVYTSTGTSISQGSKFKLGTGIKGTLSGFTMRFSSGPGGTGLHPTVEMGIYCYHDSGYTVLDSSCSWNYDPTQTRNGEVWTTTGNIPQGSDYVYTFQTTNIGGLTPITFNSSYYYALYVTYVNHTSYPAYVWTDSSNNWFYNIFAESNLTLKLETSSPYLPGEALSYEGVWTGWFFPLTQIQYVFWFPNGYHSNGTYPLTQTPQVLVDGVPQQNGLTGTGSISFTYTYTTTGTMTGQLVATTNCSLSQYEKSPLSCDYAEAQEVINVGNTFTSADGTSAPVGVEGLTPPAQKTYAYGGGTDSGYLASDKKVYEINEPVYLDWHFSFGSGKTLQYTKLNNGDGLTVTTLTGAFLSQHKDHYAIIFYPSAGTYDPYITLCFTLACSGTGGTTFYIGGGSSPSAVSTITVLSSAYQGLGSTPALIPQGCAQVGLFGSGATFYKLNFTQSGSNAFVQGIQNVGNQGIQSFLWLAGNLFCYVSEAPIISDVTDIVAPKPGTYTLPKSTVSTMWYSKLFDIFPDNSYTITYATDTASNTVWSYLSQILFYGSILLYIIKYML